MEEYDLIQKKLAFVRDNIFDNSDFKTDEGFDLTGCYMGSPYEVLHGMIRKITRQQNEINKLKEAVEIIESEYWNR